MKMQVAILGTGNIGIDLLYKIQKSNSLECVLFSGRNRDSEGIAIAEKMGIPTSFESLQGILDCSSRIDIVFDATSASAHIVNAPILRERGIFTIDLTPSKVGEMCVPVINVEDVLDKLNVNTITCGGQATVPIISAMTKVHQDIKYVEIVASIASRSAGMGTRQNIDEFTQTTKDAIIKFCKVDKAKAIIILNPAEPPIKMRNTIYAVIDNPNLDKLKMEIDKVVVEMRKYIKGYNVILGPLVERGHVTVTVEVIGAGDYLPSYSGNLDIITCAAVYIAEQYCRSKNNE